MILESGIVQIGHQFLVQDGHNLGGGQLESQLFIEGFIVYVCVWGGVVCVHACMHVCVRVRCKVCWLSLSCSCREL